MIVRGGASSRRGLGRPATPPAPAVPAWVSALPLWQWYSIPNTDLETKCPPTVTTYGYPTGKLIAWCGAALKRQGSVYLIGGGGGHSDYAGNEVNALALNVETPQWVQLNAPTGRALIHDNSPFYADYRPAPAHTYLNAHYLRSLDSYVIFCRSGISFGGGMPAPPGGWPYPHTDTYSKVFNLGVNDWELAPSPSVAQHPSFFMSTDVPLSFLHPITEDFYMSPSHTGGWWKWTRATNTWATTGGGNRSPWYAGVDVDPTRDRILIFGGYNSTNPFITNLAGTMNYGVTFGGLGSAVLRAAAIMQYPGVAYDDYEDRFFCIYNDEAANAIKFYTVDAATYSVAQPTVTGTMPTARINGIHNSCRYVPELKGLVIANSYSQNVKFMRVSL